MKTFLVFKEFHIRDLSMERNPVKVTVNNNHDRRLFRQVVDLSAGTMSYLIDCTLYDVVYTVKHEFALWCIRNPNYDDWIDAWKVFENGNK